ncbi:hypothetical protein ABZ848_27625 [Streptomyces sp. NPDC047081]|uniref:hypothetical protein n=1 Tax=Streptomyces sp. NPDC047081 TaxID=3154706 RepID=UPI0033DE58C3
MTRPPTAAQRRVIDAADPVTGRVRGTETQLAALVKRGLAFRHPRPPHDHFLTPAGHRIREGEEPGAAGVGAGAAGAGPAQTGAGGAAGTGPGGVGGAAGVGAAAVAARAAGAGGRASGGAEAGGAGGVFAARVGGEESAPVSRVARVREVHSAWQGLLELRRMTNPDAATDRPCGWERTHLVQAAALALEAAGHAPETGDSPGYRVRATPQPDAVAVHAPDAEALRTCAITLEGAGWQAGEYTEPRTRVRYLLASPRRV